MIAFATYSFESDTNPVTGKRQHVAMNVDQEIRLGLESAPQMAAEMGGAADPATTPAPGSSPRSAAGSSRRATPAAALMSATTTSSAERPRNHQRLRLARGPGLHHPRVCSTSSTTRPSSPASWGTRSAHVVNRHAAEHMATGRLGQLLTLAVGVGASDRDHRRNAQMVAALVNQMTQLKFTREDESEADRYGLRYMAEAGYDPSAMLDVMKILKQASRGSRQPEILSTHPCPKPDSRKSATSWPTTTRRASPRPDPRGALVPGEDDRRPGSRVIRP